MKKADIERFQKAAKEAAASAAGITAETYAGMSEEEHVLFNKVISVNEDLKLSEVKERITKTRGEDILTVKALRRTGTIVAAKEVHDCRVEVYDNGFAAYLKPKHETVLRMEYVHSESFEGNPDVEIPDRKYNLSKDNWGEAVMFAGEKRMEERYVEMFVDTRTSLTGNGAPDEDGEETDMDPAGSANVEMAVIMQDEKERLWGMAGGVLSERQMEIVRLRIEEEFGWTEIGKKLGIKPGSVKGTFDRAIEKLQKNKKFFEEFL